MCLRTDFHNNQNKLKLYHWKLKYLDLKTTKKTFTIVNLKKNIEQLK